MQNDARHVLGAALSTGFLAQWSLLLLLVWIWSRAAAIPIVAGTLVLAVVAFFLGKPVAVVYSLIALGPFYDFSRALLFPEGQLLGFWQDAFVALLLMAAIRNVMGYGWPKVLLVDKFVIGFIAAYAFSLAVSANSRIWFYGFRWLVLYPVMYLVLRTFHFTEQQRRRMMLVLTTSLVLSAILGLLEIWYLGWDAIVELDRAVNFILMGRNDQYRWAATFSSPIIASGAFALLFLIFAASVNFTRRRVLSLMGCVFSILCIYLTHSRSGIVIAASGLLAIVWAVRSRYWKPWLAGSVIAVTFLGYQVSQTVDQYDMLRLHQFARTVAEAITTHPLGTGGGTAGAVSFAAAAFAGQNPAYVDPVVGDSVPLAVLRDTGWFGLVCFAGICFSVIGLAWRARTTMIGLLALAYWSGSVINLMNATDVYPTKLYLWLLAALAATEVARQDSVPSAELEASYVVPSQLLDGNSAGVV